MQLANPTVLVVSAIIALVALVVSSLIGQAAFNSFQEQSKESMRRFHARSANFTFGSPGLPDVTDLPRVPTGLNIAATVTKYFVFYPSAATFLGSLGVIIYRAVTT